MSGSSSSANDPVRPVLKRFLDAVKACDAEAVASVFTEDAVLMTPNEPTLYGVQEIKEWWQEYFEYFKVSDFTETERDVTFFDDAAVERWAYVVTIASIKSRETMRDEGRWLGVWKRGPDGAWQIEQAMFNSILPIGSGTSRFLTRVMERNKGL